MQKNLEFREKGKIKRKKVKKECQAFLKMSRNN